jgi:hypothetical protein
MILGPTGWSVLRRHSLDALSLSPASKGARYVSGDRPVRGKIGICPGEWAAFIAPTAYEAVEGDR